MPFAFLAFFLLSGAAETSPLVLSSSSSAVFVRLDAAAVSADDMARLRARVVTEVVEAVDLGGEACRRSPLREVGAEERVVDGIGGMGQLDQWWWGEKGRIDG